jgi:hypothetical protein
MTWSLGIQSGDLNLSSRQNGMGIVTGAQKTFQDIRNEIYEPMGTDPIHAEYGSLIDGGITPDGHLVESPIGNIIGAETILALEQEVQRIVQGVIKRQRERLLFEVERLNGQHYFTANELISNIESVETKQIGDVLAIRLRLRMNNGETIEIVRAAV